MSAARLALGDLAACVRADLEQADRHAADLAALLGDLPGRYNHFAAALLLHNLYGAIEAVLERSVKLFDGLLPEGSDWHSRLVTLASTEIAGLRPAILPPSEVVDELRRFRHRLRKRYDAGLDPERVFSLARSATTSWPEIRASLEAFLSWVDECGGTAT